MQPRLQQLITLYQSQEIEKLARIEIQKLLTLFQIADVNSTVLSMSINSSFRDFEELSPIFFRKVYQGKRVSDQKYEGL